MRAIPILIACLISSSIARAGEEAGTPPATLTAAEVHRALQPYRNEIRGCYQASAEAGSLQLDLIIHRDGSVYQLIVTTPKVAPRAARTIDRCIRQLSTRWQFPVRGALTTITVPYRFTASIAAA
jgi:hypothetical protein